MQTVNHLYKNKQALQAFLDTLETEGKGILVQLFSGQRKLKKIRKILQMLTAHLGDDAVIAGASSAGEVVNGKLKEGSIVLSVSLFETTRIRSAYFTTPEELDLLKNDLIKEDTKALILFSSGISQNGEEIIRRVASLKEGLVVSGGFAGDNGDFEDCFVYDGEEIRQECTLAVSLSGDSLHVTAKALFDWKPIGSTFTITRCKENIIYTADDIPIKEVYRRFLGDDIADNIPESANQFPLLLSKHKGVAARTPMLEKEGGILFSGTVRKGESFSFGFGDIRTIKEAAEANFARLASTPCESIFVYASSSRRIFLPVNIRREITTLKSIAPVSGFFTYGEYCLNDETAEFYNLSTSILSLSESETTSQAEYLFDVKKEKSTYTRSMAGLMHLINNTTRSLNESTSLLQQYKEAVDHTVIFSKTDTKGIITYVNDMFCEISGYSKEELIGKSHNIIRHPDMEPEVFKEMWKTIKSGQIWQGIVKNRAKNGYTYIVDSTIFPIFDNNGTIVEYMALRVDITFLSQKQNELEWREKLTSEILNNQESIVALTAKDTGLIQVNQRFFDYFDFKDFEDLKSKHYCICDLFVKEEGYIYSIKGEMDWVEKPLERNDRKFKVKMIDKHGEAKIFTIKTNHFSHNDKDLYVVTLSDVTELEQALKRAKSAEVAKANFLANMSHEIRTPMNGITGFTQLLVESGLTQEQKRYATIIKNSTKTLMGIVNDILDISKIESGKMTLEMQMIDPVAEITPAFEIFESVAGEKELDYLTFIDPALPKMISADALRLKQVMSNLIGNAIKFTPDRGYIHIIMELVEKEASHCKIRFAVRDSGIGIPQAKQEEIFGAFSQADDSITRKFGGTGLGLTISANFVELMGSRLEVDSREGEGSEFSFELTVDTFDPETRYTPFEGRHAVIYSDRESRDIAREDLERYLKRMGIATTAETGEGDLLFYITKESLLLFTPAFFDDREIGNIPKAMEEMKQTQLAIDETMEVIANPVNDVKLYDTIGRLLHSIRTEETDEEEGEASVYDATVLVVEDNDINQSLISLLLEQQGIIPDIADNGLQAVEMFTAKRYDLILMDINMPVMDGLEATRQIREYEGVNSFDPCPIIALTANVMKEDRERFLRGGMDDYLTKPIDPERLGEVLARYCTSLRQTKADLPYNTAELAETLGIDEDFVQKLIQKFIHSADEYLENIAIAVGNHEVEALKQAAHKLHGTAANLRFNRIGELAASIEKEVRSQGITETVSTLLEELRSEITRLRA